jgi:hypothetical protein
MGGSCGLRGLEETHASPRIRDREELPIRRPAFLLSGTKTRWARVFAN